MSAPATLLRRDGLWRLTRRRVKPMSPRVRAALALSTLGALLLVAAGCIGSSVPHTDLDGDLAALRAAFNRDVDRVRAVLLGAPT